MIKLNSNSVAVDEVSDVKKAEKILRDKIKNKKQKTIIQKFEKK